MTTRDRLGHSPTHDQHQRALDDERLQGSAHLGREGAHDGNGDRLARKDDSQHRMVVKRARGVRDVLRDRSLSQRRLSD